MSVLTAQESRELMLRAAAYPEHLGPAERSDFRGFLSLLAESDVLRLADLCVVVRVAPGVQLTQEGLPASFCAILLEGEVALR